ncbi:O-antigen ligase family protein [Paenibacillus filicis]|uniref:O-antigen ligase family protein n=1 Tax=Paenibacillus gyeongsangnamensis TaxID=3388067 RepID=A0ABT4Q6N7_9BACL|nr:O-antigen ligase family protein [Paenibacillus filicis]MCZ8512540.1 O-antigen ligase family protein [Paenibacillus filicis]
MSTKKTYGHPYSSGLNKQSKTSDTSSILFWILTGFTLLFLIWAPFQKALFNGNSFDFERPIYSSFVWSSIILVLIGIFAFYRWSLKSSSELLSLAVWLVPITYVISMFGAGSHYYATNMIYIQTIYVTFLLLGFFLARTDLGAAVLKNGFMTSAYVIVFFGFFNWFGNKQIAFSWVKWFAAEMRGNPIYQDAVMTDTNGLRLTSVFQYANSYAAFLIGVLLCTLFLVLSSKKWISIGIHGFLAVPIIISFFLTLSRGGLVILPVVLLLVLPFLKPYKQILYIVHLIVSFGLSFTILSKLTNMGIELNKSFSAASSLRAWLILLGVSLVNAVLAVLIQRFASDWLSRKLERFDKSRYANVAIPVVALIVGAIGVTVLFADLGFTKLLPDNIRTRVENINFQQHSVLERGTFYKDGMKLFADYPVFGAGGGAWAALYEKYQNNPYVSRQAHNFFLQYLVEVGLVGFIVFLLLLAAVFYIYIRNYLKQDETTRDKRFIFYILVISLLVHSMIDFDLSYVYLGVLLFLSLGVLISKDEFEIKGAWIEKLVKVKWAYPSLLLVLSLVCFFNAVSALTANSLYANAVAAAQINKNITEIFTPLDKALNQHPNHPDYAGFKIDILMQAYRQTKDDSWYNQAMALMNQTMAKEPHNRTLLEKQIGAYTEKGDIPKALELVNNNIPNYPWDITLYEKNISMNFDLGNASQTANNTKLRDQYWNAAFDTYNQVQERVKQLASLPKEQLQGREFGLTKNMGFALGQIDFIRGKFAEAEPFLKVGLTDQFDDQLNKQMTRWYLADLQRQGKNDQALYDKLIAKDPNEKTEIFKLVNAKI